MDNFVTSPNLPLNARHILIGEKYVSDLQASLEALGLELISIPANMRVDPRLSSHADLSIFHGGDHSIFTANILKETKFAKFLTESGVSIKFCASDQAKQYPLDASINVCCVGNYFIYNPKVSDQAIISWLMEQGRVAVACKQGYCRCSVCVVNENSIICSDKGISTACKAVGLEVLEIQPGFIQLEGFDYGFIGGASFKLSYDKLAFTGFLDAHPDKEKIFDFLQSRGITPVFLTDKPIFDIGSAVILTEEEPKN